ncbi:PREDICTED: uncharacterized protein LOC109243223 [Nicotiana attenuata]|uniref:uncharacterized protein LOC109243223 n=1 Tax=Nicotiana attenuata TaxID=49451 RepID=UPI0009054296|nr:PREDICTED: uncharacterized protein LOC109243223 [Nicotiana attenuata]
MSSSDTTKETWDKLEVTYERTSKVRETRINMLVHDYELFQMKEGESIEKIFARFNIIIEDLKAFGKPYSSGDQVRKVLRSLPTTWQTKVVALESQDLNKLSYDELRGYLIAFKKTHLKKMNQEEKTKIVAFKTKTEGPENDIDDDPEALEEEIAMDIVDLTLKESQKKLNELRRHNREKKDWELKLEAYEIESDDGFENPKTTLILVKSTNKDPSKLGYLKECDDSILQEHHRKSHKGKWYVDSAYSSHMTGDKNLFKEVTKINGGNVKFGDDLRGKIVGTGTVPFSNNCDIAEVYLVDGLNYNLLSISQLCDSGYEVKFKKTVCTIEDEAGKIILPGKRYENVYILDGIENRIAISV